MRLPPNFRFHVHTRLGRKAASFPDGPLAGRILRSRGANRKTALAKYLDWDVCWASGQFVSKILIGGRKETVRFI